MASLGPILPLHSVSSTTRLPTIMLYRTFQHAVRCVKGGGGRQPDTRCPDTRFHLFSDTAMCGDPWIVRIPRCAERVDHELRTAGGISTSMEKWGAGELRAAMALSRASLSALLFGTTRPKMKGAKGASRGKKTGTRGWG